MACLCSTQQTPIQGLVCAAPHFRPRRVVSLWVGPPPGSPAALTQTRPDPRISGFLPLSFLEACDTV